MEVKQSLKVTHGYGNEVSIYLNDMELGGVKSFVIKGSNGSLPELTVTMDVLSAIYKTDKDEMEAEREKATPESKNQELQKSPILEEVIWGGKEMPSTLQTPHDLSTTNKEMLNRCHFD